MAHRTPSSLQKANFSRGVLESLRCLLPSNCPGCAHTYKVRLLSSAATHAGWSACHSRIDECRIVAHLTPSSSLKATISTGALKSLCTLLPNHCPRSADSLTAARTSSGRMIRASRAACAIFQYPLTRGIKGQGCCDGNMIMLVPCNCRSWYMHFVP